MVTGPLLILEMFLNKQNDAKVVCAKANKYKHPD